jgi:hypothetical protein
MDFRAAWQLLPEDGRNLDGLRLVCRCRAIHELGHVVLARDDWREQQAFAPNASHAITVDPATPPESWWPWHGADWIRATVHLMHRAARRGIRTLPAITLALDAFKLSDAEGYIVALGNEPERMVDATFDAILSTPAPRAFTELYRQQDAARRAASVSPTAAAQCERGVR